MSTTLTGACSIIVRSVASIADPMGIAIALRSQARGMPRSAAADASAQVDGVADRAAVPVVVEVDEAR